MHLFHKLGQLLHLVFLAGLGLVVLVLLVVVEALTAYHCLWFGVPGPRSKDANSRLQAKFAWALAHNLCTNTIHKH